MAKIVEFFGVPGAGKTTVAKALQEAGRLPLEVVIDRPAQRSRARKVSARVRRHLSRTPNHIATLASFAASHPQMITAFEAGVAADSPEHAEGHWGNLLSWIVKFQAIEASKSAVLIDSGWCQRAAGEFAAADEGPVLAEAFIDAMPKPDAAVAFVVSPETSVERMRSRGFRPNRYRAVAWEDMHEAMSRYKLTVEQTGSSEVSGVTG